MTDVERIEWQFVAVDKASATLSKISNAADRVAKHLDSLSGLLAGLGAALGVRRIVAGLDDTYRSVLRIKTVTGLSAQDAYGLSHALELAGVRDGERVITRMSLRVQQLGEGMGVGAKQGGMLRRQFQAMGVDIKAGPVQAMLQLSAAVKAGKADAGEVASLLRIRPDQIAPFMTALSQGPQAMAKAIEDAKKSAGAIDDAALAAWTKMRQAKIALSQSFQSAANIIYAAVLPGIAEVVSQIHDGIEKAKPKIEKIGKFLKQHMHEIVHLAKIFLATMTTQKLLSMFGVKGGLFGLLRRGAGAVGGMMSAGASAGRAVGGALATGARGIALGMIPGGGLLASIGPAVSAIAGAFLPILAIIIVIVAAFKGVARHFKEIWAHFQGLINVFKTVWNFMKAIGEAIWDNFIKPISDFVGDVIAKILVTAIDLIKDTIMGIMEVTVLIGLILKNLFTLHWKKALSFGDEWQEAKGMIQGLMPEATSTKSVAKVPDTGKPADALDGAGGPPTNNYDFRGSRFDIKQDFADIDPDRVAVAFATDLARVGERRLASAFVPLGAIR